MKHLDPIEQVPEPDGGFERRIWERIRPRVQRSIKQRKRRRFVVLAGTCAAVASMVVVFGLQRRTASLPKVADNGAARVLQSALREHLDRSQILLTELEHLTPGEAQTEGEKDWARALLDDNRLLREASLRHKEYGRVAVLDALEPTLLTVANAPREMTKTEVDSLQERLKENSLLFKVRIARSQLESRNSGMERPL